MKKYQVMLEDANGSRTLISTNKSVCSFMYTSLQNMFEEVTETENTEFWDEDENVVAVVEVEENLNTLVLIEDVL